ncbi:HAD-IIA family hydrolase [Alkalibacillus haloalkaliphilus]|uniref:HAD-IIA family hydrolase n=1 Tax=Alkalibacillus haloalkaliphilus TaxID=94136 RepID=UPI0002DE4063|nr:HAD-IIA family hydrolase [Alkalibacillus haloalkaliphilus]
MDQQGVKAIIFDLDGTIYLGDYIIQNANDTVNKLLDCGYEILFLTNKTIESREKYVEKLKGFNIKVTEENIINPTVTLINYLKINHPGQKIYVIGEQVIKDEMKENNFTFAQDPKETDIVVVSWDRNFNYSQLNFAYQSVKLGAKTIATNPDRTCPVEEGDVPDNAGMIGALESVTGKPIDVQVGKPSIHTINSAMDLLGLNVDECLMVGDRIETDIKMGIDAGMKTALVLSGVSQRSDLDQVEYSPDYVIDTVSDLLSLFTINS